MERNELFFQDPKNENNDNANEAENLQNEINTVNNALYQNLLNNNQNNIENKEKEIEETDDVENLRYKDMNCNNIDPRIQQRLDSCDSQVANHFKFSIDMPNVSKQRLHEYLNDDLLNALDVSPNIPNLNSGINNNKKLSISNENAIYKHVNSLCLILSLLVL